MNILAYVHLRNIYGSTGAGRVARNMVEQLQLSGDDEVVVLVDPADHERIVPLVKAPWDRYQYRFFSMETSRQQACWMLTDRPSAETYWAEAQIMYCTAESYVPVRRARLAVTVHDAAFFERDAHPRTWLVWKQRQKWRHLYRKLTARADRLFAVSQFSAERLAYFFPALTDRLRVIPNGIPERFFAPVSQHGEEALADIGLMGRPFILIPRGLHYRKNADFILQTWPRLRSKHPDLLLVVTSHNDPAYVEKARALGPSVRITGFIDDELLCSLYHSAVAVWFPSLYEGFGLPTLEAMACGTPVVASDSASLPEVTGDAALLVPRYSPDEHIDAIDSVLSSTSLRDRLVRSGHARAQLFTWRSAAAKLRAEMQALL